MPFTKLTADQKALVADAVKTITSEYGAQRCLEIAKQDGEGQRYVTFFKSSRPVEKGGEVLIPGEPEIRTRRKRLAEGIPLPDDTWARIVAAAREVGVDERTIQQATEAA